MLVHNFKTAVKYHEWMKCTCTEFVLRSHLYNNGVFVADTVLNTITKDINIIKKKIKLGRKNLWLNVYHIQSVKLIVNLIES